MAWCWPDEFVVQWSIGHDIIDLPWVRGQIHESRTGEQGIQSAHRWHGVVVGCGQVEEDICRTISFEFMRIFSKLSYFTVIQVI